MLQERHDTELEELFNFYEKYKEQIEPQILAPLVHFLFVSIHLFIDGNGRVARLIHSFILMKAGMPLFAFDPDYRNIYFDLLDKGRAESVEEFVQFCIDRHRELIEHM
ncbi:MAG TPA: Fic family protein [archaeon]|nr:Fic family protein [archaeon]